MRPFWARLLRHAAVAGIALAGIGYLLGRAFLYSHRLYGGGAYNPDNERVLWQCPAVMAGFGILLTAGMDALLYLLRRPVHVPAADPAPKS